MAFGDKLKEFREMRHFTIADLSRATDIPWETIKRLENNERNPRWDVVLKLAKALAVKLDDFVDLEPALAELVRA